MLNYLWAFMMLIGIVYGAVTGNIEAVSNGILDSAVEAVTLCMKMLGIIAMWTGIMHIGEKSGLVDAAAKRLSPLIRFLFPNIPDRHPAKEHIATNMIANFLGLGWAATPAGLKAMESLKELDEERSGGKLSGIASDEMCTFLVINISSLQLIPVNMIAYRSQYGSVNPAAIVVPALIATTISTVAGIVFCKIKCRKNFHE
ncbi:MAG: nucleoside recognition protein [Lachnospiraceae bacterium]|nr:nucleoside recognition protein [Lachnospiraceae bacterium]